MLLPLIVSTIFGKVLSWSHRHSQSHSHMPLDTITNGMNTNKYYGFDIESELFELVSLIAYFKIVISTIWNHKRSQHQSLHSFVFSFFYFVFLWNPPHKRQCWRQTTSIKWNFCRMPMASIIFSFPLLLPNNHLCHFELLYYQKERKKEKQLYVNLPVWWVAFFVYLSAHQCMNFNSP